MIRVALLASVVALAGCPSSDPPADDIILYGLTNAPPASKGTIVSSELDGYTITLTRGVAIGARCWDSCDYDCIAPRITVDDEAILATRTMWRPTGGDSDLVLVAMAAGTTSIDVATSCATRRYTVTVLAP